jgi:hypothetical protein
MLNMAVNKGDALCKILRVVFPVNDTKLQGTKDDNGDASAPHMELLNWLRSMDDDEFGGAEEEAQNKEQKDCPDELWDPQLRLGKPLGLDGNLIALITHRDCT